jgi:hypothetical protein
VNPSVDFAQPSPVGAADPHPRFVGEDLPRQRRPPRIALDTEQPRVRMSGTDHPGRPDAETGAGLTDAPPTDPTREHLQQAPVLRHAGVTKPGTPGSPDGVGHPRRQVHDALMGRSPVDCHE